MTGTDQLNALKKVLILKTGINGNDLAECVALKTLIERKSKKFIAVITLQRLFDLAPSEFFPSVYTLNTIAFFCDYEGWNDFLSQHTNEN